MMRLLGLLAVLAHPALAEGIVPTRLIRPQEVIRDGDLTKSKTAIDRGVAEITTLIGLEARVTLYPGRPVGPDDFAPLAVIDRNQIVPLIYQVGALRIAAEGRALARAAVGETIRVMNLASRSTVTGAVQPDGSIHVTR